MADVQRCCKGWLFFTICALLNIFASSYDDDNDYLDPAKACLKWFPPPVENICHETFPEKTSEKTWIMLFSSHACPGCVQVQEDYVEWAKKLRMDPSVRVGVVNCYWAVNYNNLCYPRHKVDALPTLRIIEKGKFEYDGKTKHNSADVNRMITAKLKALGTCPEGAAGTNFLSAKSTPVVPLCKKRFPGRETTSTWMVIYYTKSSAVPVLEAARQAAVELGNTGSAELAADETKWARLKKRERLFELRDKYGFSLQLPREGPLGKDALVYVGAVCCDCDSEQEAFCKNVMGGYTGPLPALGWSQGGEQRDIEFMVKTPWALLEYSLTQLGFMEKSALEL